MYSLDSDLIDLVILDMVMPDMNGRDCFFALRESDPGVNVLLSSGSSRDEDIELMEAEGLSGIVEKPFRSAVLGKAVSEALKHEK